MPDAAPSLRFAEAARRLAAAARRRGLLVPGFRSPPALPSADRTLRHRPDGGVTVAVRTRGRSLEAVVADLVEGVIAANRLAGEAADRARAELLGEVSPQAPSRAA